MYTPKYMDILRKRTDIPKVVSSGGMDRLIILPDEEKEKTTTAGRPIGKEYFCVESKLKFMDIHNIDKSVISLANPWLDFLQGQEAASVSQELNDELESICEKSRGRLYGFATLPMRNPAAAIKEVKRIKSLPHMRGVILGTPGAGKGLDDLALRDVLHAIADGDLMVFLHPHYGVGNEHYHDAGHALFLALGFPFETTVCVSRLIVSGTLDQVPNLKLLVAHAGAALPGLIGRLDSCVAHDLAVANKLKQAPSAYLKNMFFDAISYHPLALQMLVNMVGEDRIMFGTDNPFFPPLGVPDVVNARWPSTEKVQVGIDQLKNNAIEEKVRRGNAIHWLKI